ncbi:MAG: DUF3035 domain-containing protein [Micavibrio aeruginosavorus]|uniref:DUF3035 domain-containing protein n=1 Tax=Micavibrio aeruginosavorus TaxID=349221 RepID=A0A2W5HFN8_9BACT|nr:MAG: DUF3035 domain-containing protein [Micavibrio aeruginosavorus]
MKKLIIISLLTATIVSGCARAKQELGLTRRTPDEFAVVKRAPLEIPPDLNQVSALPQPVPGKQRPQEASPEQAAQAAILGSQIPTLEQSSTGESALLQKAGASSAVTNIRNVVDREAVDTAEKNRPVAKRIMNWGNKDDAGAAVIVDAPAEAKRIKQKQAGETPSIEE